jgi:hypothetical protein
MIDLFVSLFFILIVTLLVGGIVVAILLMMAEALQRRPVSPGTNRNSDRLGRPQLSPCGQRPLDN